MSFSIETFGGDATPDVILRTTGTFDAEVASEMRDALQGVIARGIGRRVLIDHSALDGIGWDSGEARAIARVLARMDSQCLPGTKVAILAPTTVDFGSMRMMLTHVELEHGREQEDDIPLRKVFTDLGDAILWLDQPA